MEFHRVLQKAYADLKLGETVFQAVLSAHQKVLACGLETGNERIIAVDCKTGAEIVNRIGTPDRVNWAYSLDYSGKMITIHNHPNNTPFSPLDLYTFGTRKRIYCTVIQCHNGTVYRLRKTGNVKFGYELDALSVLLDKVLNGDQYRGKTLVERGEIYVKLIAKVLQWTYTKEEF